MKKNNNDNLPQLIVALDGIEEDANYIHILDAKDDVEYFCPCCHGKVLPRAYKRDKYYEVQPHFYHDSGGCSNESYLHFICKNWLMVPGCKFIVEDTEYEVESVDVEKTLKTDAGIYKPDIIVNSTSGKIFYFEIRVTNKKKIDTIRKWDELGNDVVEVDVRYFANQKYKNEIPIFNLIYSDGRCFIQEYIPKNYSDVIGVRKLHWKRQDRIDYKIQWERLDWFWQCLSDFDGINKDNVLSAYKSLDYEDMEWCYFNIQGKSCVALKSDFQEILTSETIARISQLKYEEVEVKLNRKSALIYEARIMANRNYMSYRMRNVAELKLRFIKGVLCSDHIEQIKDAMQDIDAKLMKDIKVLTKISDDISKLPYVKSIVPQSSLTKEYSSVKDIPFKVCIQGRIRNEIYEEIGQTTIYPLQYEYPYLFSNLEEKYSIFLEMTTELLRREQIVKKLENDEIVSSWDGYDKNGFKVKRNGLTFSLLKNKLCIASFKFNSPEQSSQLLEDIFTECINYRTNYEEVLDEYVRKINSCKNEIWKIYANQAVNGCDCYTLYLKYENETYSKRIHIKYKTNRKNYDSYIKDCFKNEMLQMIREKLGQVLPV